MAFKDGLDYFAALAKERERVGKEKEKIQTDLVDLISKVQTTKLAQENQRLKTIMSNPALMREIAANQNPFAQFNPQTGSRLPQGNRQFPQPSFNQFLPGQQLQPGEPSRQPGAIDPRTRGFVAEGKPREAPPIPVASQPQLGRNLRQESTDNLEKLANGNIGGLSGFISQSLGQRANVDPAVQAEAISALRARGIPFQGKFVPKSIKEANEEELELLKEFDNIPTFEDQKIALADPELGKILILYGKKENKPLARNVKR